MWAFWTLLFTNGVFAVPGIGQLVSLVLAALAGWYAFRIWTGRAKYLTIFLIF